MYKELIDNYPGMVYRCKADAEWTIEYVSPCCRDFLGYEPGDLAGGHHILFTDIIHPDDGDKAVEKIRRLISEKKIFQVEYRIKTGSGREKWVMDHGCGLYSPDGQLLGLQGFISDIENRKRYENEYRMSEAFNQTLISSAGVGVIVYDKNLRIKVWNKFMEDLTGLPVPEVVGKPALDMFPHLREQGIDKLLKKALKGETKMSGDTPYHVPQTGRKGYVLGLYSPHYDVDKNIIGVVEIVHEISERRESEEALRRSEEKYRTLFDSSPESIFVIGLDGKIIDCNTAAGSITGMSRQEFLESNVENLIFRILDEDREKSREIFSKLSEGVEVGPIEFPLETKTGETRWVEVFPSLIHREGKPYALQAIARDITDRKKAEEDLIFERDFSKSIIETAHAIVLILDPDGRILTYNPYMEDISGYPLEETRGKDWFSIFIPGRQRQKIRELFMKTKDEEKISGIVNTILTKHGRELEIEWYNRTLKDHKGAAIGVLAIGQDITERKQLEKQYLQSQKMEAVGLLAGGVAHDFNNILTVIINYSEMLMNNLKLDDKTRRDIKEIYTAGERAAILTRQLLAFSRKQVLKPEVFNLNTIILDLCKMLGRLIGENIVLVTDLDPELGNVRADPGQIEQVLMNIAVNAKDAMPRGGKLTITTRNEFLENDSQSSEFIQTGKYAMVSIKDTGYGIDETTRARIFEPFFTTKGKGTGLGLATAYGIVKQSGGYIMVESEPEKFTDFKIYFPLVYEEEAKKADEKTVHSKPLIGTETILLVEDDNSMRAITYRMLKRLGYKIITARNAKEALDISTIYNRKIDLMITDVVMPGESGTSLAQKLTASRPDMKIIYMSGYTDDAILIHGVLDGKTIFIQKPFILEELATKLRIALESP